MAPDEIIVSSSDLPEPPNKIFGYNYDGILISNEMVPIRFVNRTRRGLHGFPRNQGADNCDSDFIMFFDVDDIPHPQKIGVTKFILRNCGDALVHNYYLDNSNFTNYLNFTHSEIHGKNPSNTNLLADDWVHHGHLTIRPEIVRQIRYNEHRTLGEDGEFCQAVYDQGHKILYCPHQLVCYNTVRQ
jgi:glycosyltransferase involved in cell wall biosynthesis